MVARADAELVVVSEIAPRRVHLALVACDRPLRRPPACQTQGDRRPWSCWLEQPPRGSGWAHNWPNLLPGGVVPPRAARRALKMARKTSSGTGKASSSVLHRRWIHFQCGRRRRSAASLLAQGSGVSSRPCSQMTAASHAPPSSGSKTRLAVEWSSVQACDARMAAPRRGRFLDASTSCSPPPRLLRAAASKGRTLRA